MMYSTQWIVNENRVCRRRLQVNVKLQERRNEALKWELLRQGGSQEKFDDIAKEVCATEHAAECGIRNYEVENGRKSLTRRQLRSRHCLVPIELFCSSVMVTTFLFFVAPNKWPSRARTGVRTMD